jgi:hypothetical protein
MLRKRYGNPRLSLRAFAFAMVFFALYWLACIILLAGKADAHEWFPPSCCSGHDCKVIKPDDVKTTKRGFEIPGNPEVVPYSSPKIRHTPPEGEGNYALCTKGGKPDGEVICLYIPTWGT